MSERIKPQIMVQHVEFLQRCLDGNLPALRTLHEICTEIAWLRGDVDVNWQSRALAAEQKLESLSNVLMNINDTCRVRGFAAGLGNPTDQRVIDMIQASEKARDFLRATCETAEQERDQLKAELQQVREAVEWVKKHGLIIKLMAGKVAIYAKTQAERKAIDNLRAILERIEKEKTSPH